jgi:all-trans-retinol 13,14-reductase
MTSSIASSQGFDSTKILSEENTWEVRGVTEKAKGDLDFDAIVVGSGVGGLACAAILAKRNLKVLVLEQGGQFGGFCSSFKRGDFTFTTGIQDFTGVDDGGIKLLLDDLELKKDDLFVLNTRLFKVGDKTIILDGTKQGTITALSAAFPEEALAICSFINEGDLALHKDPKILSDWKSVTYEKKLEQFFKDPDLKLFFRSQLEHIGVRAAEVQASDVIRAGLSHLIAGSYYPIGGPQHFVDILCDYIRAHGGSLRTKACVEEILTRYDMVSGVKVGDQTYSSPIVVANANAKTVFTKLLPEGRVNKAYVDAIKSFPMSMSVCMVQVGTDLDLQSLPSQIHVLDPQKSGCHGIINSNADATLAPKGKSCITFLVEGNYSTTPSRETVDYARYKKELASRVLSLAETVIPHLHEHILVQDVSTPPTFERYTSMPEGAIYGFDLMKGNPPYFKTPLQGLYLASACTFGGGLDSVAYAGICCAGDIWKFANMPEDVDMF